MFFETQYSGLVVNAVCPINVVVLRRARLVLGWAGMFVSRIAQKVTGAFG